MQCSRVSFAALLATFALAAPAAAQQPEYGVAAGEVKPTSAVLWTRAPAAGPVTLRIDNSRTVRLNASADNDLTVQTRVRKLKPNRRYRYRFTQGSWNSDLGVFRTAPKANSNGRVKFAYSGDTDAQPAFPGAPPFYNNFEVYGQMADEDNSFNINLGDTIYSDTEVDASIVNGRFEPSSVALTLPEKWAKYRQNIALPNLQRLRGAAGFYSHWDDHEFINDFGPGSVPYADLVFPSGVKAFRDYAPVSYSAARGLYRKFRWGRNLELFFLDERSFRSPKANTACINPQNGAPDLAPTAPAVQRTTFAQLAPSLAEPVSAGCLATLNDPERTMLGSAQYRRFLRDVKRSKATFKVIVNEVPMQKLYVLPYDRWEGYAAEREKLLRQLRKVKGTVFLTTDMHANLYGEIRLRTLEGERPVGTGIYEVIAGPVATLTYAKEIDQVTRLTGSWQAIDNLFFETPPPGGLGLGTCSELDTYGYGQVDVTSKRLQVTLKDISGDRICAPLTVKAPKKKRKRRG
jgi:alkaline phosphatase D